MTKISENWNCLWNFITLMILKQNRIVLVIYVGQQIEDPELVMLDKIVLKFEGWYYAHENWVKGHWECIMRNRNPLFFCVIIIQIFLNTNFLGPHFACEKYFRLRQYFSWLTGQKHWWMFSGWRLRIGCKFWFLMATWVFTSLTDT